jgi:glycosyltransferase involved in cell wall biosynthesis
MSFRDVDSCTLSIVIPAYNVAPYIAAAVNSALQQTIHDVEVIVVDDGSTDETALVLTALAEEWRDGRLRIIRQENGGLSEARNTGIRAAKGQYIGFLDADDIWRRNKAERHLAALEADPEVAISFSHSEYITEDGLCTGRYQLSDCAAPTLIDMIRRNHVGNGSSAIARSECFRSAGLFRKELCACADYEMWCRILATTGMRAKLVPEALTLYRERPASLSYSENFVVDGELAIAALRASISAVPAEVFCVGLAETYRIAARKAASQNAKLRATTYLLTALWYNPQLMGNWRAIGTLAAIFTPARLRSYLDQRLSDLRFARVHRC